MKISFNIRFTDRPYGGGMKFASYLKAFLEDKEITVINHLDDDDIDIIFHINISFTAAYSFYAAYLYKMRYPDTIIVHRINDSGVNRQEDLMTRHMIACSSYSDYLVYISKWLRDLMLPELPSKKRCTVIYNGADTRIFNRLHKKRWNKQSKLKIVTHHWSDNYLKGHVIYKLLDDLLDQELVRNKYEFTYIGNYPKELHYKNTRLVQPLHGTDLADELKEHHVYLTASRNEAAGMHHIEGALCGLPLLYVNSGGLPEYCAKYGVEIDEENLKDKLELVYKEYDEYYARVENYENTADIMAENYLGLFRELISRRKEFSSSIGLLKYSFIYKGYIRLRDRRYFSYLEKK